MNFKTLITLLAILSAGLVPMNAAAASTATTTVTANIVPAVTVTMPDSIVMGQVKNSVMSEHKESINLSTVDEAAKFNIKSSGKFTYSMTVSSKVNLSNKAGKKTSINNFRLPSGSGYVTSDNTRELHMAGALDKGDEPKRGRYTGQVYLTANFN